MATGTVKFVKKNFGFITDNDSGDDIFVHLSVVKAGRFVWSDLISGVTVEYESEETAKGSQVSKVTSIGGKHAREPSKKFSPAIVKRTIGASKHVIGALKFFSKEKNYGFVEIEGFKDLFFHIDNVNCLDIKNQLQRGDVEKGRRFDVSTKMHHKPARLGRLAENKVVGVILGFHTDAPLSNKAGTVKTSQPLRPQNKREPEPIENVNFLRSAQSIAATTAA